MSDIKLAPAVGNLHPDSLRAMIGQGTAKRMARVRPVFLEEFDATGDWTASGAEVALAADAVNCMTSRAATQSLKVTMTAGQATTGSIIRTYAGPMDLKNTFFHLRLYFSVATNWVNMTLRIGSASDNYYTKAGLFSAATVAAAGWYDLVLHYPNDFTVGAGAPDATATDYFRIYLNKTAVGDEPVITFDTMQFLPPLKKAKYVLTLDDASSTHFAAAQYLASYGILATFFTPRDVVGESGYCTLAQLQQMHQAGHLIGNHLRMSLVGGATNWSDLSDTNKVYETTSSIEWHANEGFADGSRIMATPGGGWSASDWNLVQNGLLEQIRVVSQPAVAYGPCYHPGATPIVYCAANGVATITAAMNKAIAEGGVCVGLDHATGSPSANFKTHVGEVAAAMDAGLIDVCTMADLQDTVEEGPRIYFSAEAANARTVTVVFPQPYARALVWVSEAEWGAPAAADGFVTASGTTLATPTANALLDVMADSAGSLTLTLTHSAADDQFVNVLYENVRYSTGVMAFAG